MTYPHTHTLTHTDAQKQFPTLGFVTNLSCCAHFGQLNSLLCLVQQATTSSLLRMTIRGPPMCNQSECPRIIISVYTVSHSFPFEQLWLQQCSWQAPSPVASFTCSLWSICLEQYVPQTTGEMCTVVFNLHHTDFFIFWQKTSTCPRLSNSFISLISEGMVTILQHQTLRVLIQLQTVWEYATPTTQDQDLYMIIWCDTLLYPEVIRFSK